MKEKLSQINEKYSIAISCVTAAFLSIVATSFVMFFLKGTKSDLIALILLPYFLLVRILAKPFPRLTDLLISYSPGLGAIIVIVSNTGHFGAIDQTYFLCLLMSIRHYNVKSVLRTGSITLITNIIGFLLFPEPYLKIHNLAVWIFVLITYLVAMICALIIANKTHHLFEKERQLSVTECKLLHLQQLEKKNEEQEKFIHNLHHYLTAIGNLASQQNCENIINILKDMNVEINKQQTLCYTNHRVINAILSEKFFLAENNHITMDIYVEPNISFHVIPDGDIIVMLGNLLDNAFEAAEKVKEAAPFIKIRIFKENEGKICVVKIENSYKTPVKYNKKGRILTNKKQGIHGYGLKTVYETAKKFNGYLQCSHDDTLFTSILVLSLNENLHTE